MDYDFYGCVVEKNGSLYLREPLFETVKRLSDERRRHFESLIFSKNSLHDYKGAINYLDIAGAYLCEHNLQEYMPMYIRLADSYFSNFMFPIECNWLPWNRNISSVLSILKRVLSLLNAFLIGEDTEWRNKMDASEYRRLLQNNTVYFLVAYSVSSNAKGFDKVLQLTHLYTLGNIKRLVSAPTPDVLWNGSIHIGNGGGISSHEYWQEPFSWVIHESPDIDFSSSIIKTYIQYLNDLYKMYSTHPVHPLQEIIESTETRLQGLCDRNIDTCEYELDELEEKYGIKAAERDEYEQLLRESEERVFSHFSSHKDGT